MAYTKLYDGATFDIDGLTFKVEFSADEFQEMPWDNCDGHGPVRQSNARHGSGETDKRPGERPLNDAGCNEYQFYYDWQAAMKIAKRDGWNTKPYDAPNKAERAVQADFDYLRRFMSGDWCYLTVGVTCIETGETEYIGMVESEGDFTSECAREIAGNMAAEHHKENRFAEAMANAL